MNKMVEAISKMGRIKIVCMTRLISFSFPFARQSKLHQQAIFLTTTANSNIAPFSLDCPPSSFKFPRQDWPGAPSTAPSSLLSASMENPPGRNVGICLMNPSSTKIFASSRLDIPSAWRRPQGGIDENDDPRNTAIRELHEEKEVTSAGIVAEVPLRLTYDFPLQELIQECARKKMVREGKACHSNVIRLGLRVDTLISNMLLNMYSKCGLVEEARLLFDEMPRRCIVSWNTMIGSYTQNGDAKDALFLFRQMRREGSEYSEFTISGVLCACAGNLAVDECKQLHAFALKVSIESNVYVGTALVDVYAKCDKIQDATQVFHLLNDKNEVTWTSMVTGLVNNELFEEALLFFRRAKREGLEYNQFTVSSAVSACAALAALIEGNQVHAVVWKSNFGGNIYVNSCLVDLYAKCGLISDAYAVFWSVEQKNIVLWNTMVSGFARHGRPLEAMILFEKMQQVGCFPNESAYMSILSACRHKGLVDKGRKYFNLMKEEHGLSPNLCHYSCMVDVLGRGGLISEAKGLIDNMPFDPIASMWGSLLASSRIYGNVEMAEIAAKNLFDVEPNNGGNHVLLSNVYAAHRRWDDVALARKRLRDSEAKKERGKSWVEIKQHVHIFMAGEREHPRIAEIYWRLDDLLDDMIKLGYKGEIEHDLHDVEEDKKPDLLKHHSEKLAFTFGLMCLPPGVAIRIMKNLRICGDCHSFMEMASRITGRYIIVRDNNRFHHFHDGMCSCGGFW